MNEYSPQTQIKLSATFQVSDVDTDPTKATCKHKAPDGTITTETTTGANIVKDAVGQYHLNVTPTTGQLGIWYYRWIGTGTAAIAAETAFRVLDTEF